MTIFCLMHHHDNGSDAYLFQADCRGNDPPECCVDPGEVAAQLEVDFCLKLNEDIAVAEVVNFPPVLSDTLANIPIVR